MTIKLICVGKLKERYWRDAVAEYSKRLSRFCTVQIIELADEPGAADLSDASRSALLDKEGVRVLAQLRETDYAVGLCIEGETLDSPSFSIRLSKLMTGGKSTICFLIGGSWGLSEAVKARCNLHMSMGRMTFPHQLARVMLLEQVYRAFKIMNGEQYHK